MSAENISWFKYVPNGFVHVWEDAGWKALPHVLNGTGHGEYSTYMQWEGKGAPVCPPKEDAQ
jgi:hypothetical protein